MSLKQAKETAHTVTIGRKCRSKKHPHLPYRHVEAMLVGGELEWYGDHHVIATWVEHRIWAKTQCADFGPTMQLVEPAEVYARRRRQ